MKEYNIDKSFAKLSVTDSLGSQPKFLKDNYWYKYNNVGNEGLAEEMTSTLLSCSNIKEYATYENCIINGKKGCRSNSIINNNEQIITFARLYKNTHIGTLSDKIMEFRTPEERFEYLVSFIKETTGLDCTHYLYNIFALDMIIKNPDRHFDNLAVILKEDGTFKECPIFDNGQGLMQNFSITPPYMTDEEKENNLIAGTISGSFERQFCIANQYLIGEPLKIDYNKLYKLLDEKYPNKNIAKDYLIHSLEKYKTLFKGEKIKEINNIDKQYNEEYER